MMLKPVINYVRDWLDASLANRITTVATGITAIVVTIAAVASFALIQNLVGQRSTDEFRYLTRNAHERFEERMQSALSEAAQLAPSSIVRSALTDSTGRETYLQPFFRELVEASPAISGIALNDHAGAAIVSFGSCCEQTENRQDLKQAVVVEGKAFITARPTPSRPTYEITHPVLYPPSGTVEGSLSVTIDVSQIFRDSFGALPEPAFLSTLLVDASGVDENLSGRASGSGMEYLIHLHVRENSGLDLPLLGARVVSKTPTLYGELVWLSVTFLLVALLLVVAARVASMRASNRLLEPIRALSDASSKIASGRISEIGQLPEERKDEIGVLTAGFNVMTRTMREAQEQLELRVRLRTVEVARAQRQLARILESMQDIVYSCSTNFARTFYVSKSYETLSGQSAAPGFSAMARLRAMVHPDDLAAIAEFEERARSDGEGEVRYRIVHPDGTTVWLHERCRKLSGDNDEPEQFYGVITDITHGVTEEMYRREAESRLMIKDRALQSAANGIIILDVAADGSLSLEFANPAFLRITGRELEMLSGNPLGFLESAHGLSRLHADFRHAVLHGREARFQLSIEHPARPLVWVDASIAPIRDTRATGGFHMICMLEDVTLRRQQQESLHLRERAIESSSNGIVIADMQSPDHPLIYANSAFERITGYPVSEAIGRNCRFLQGTDTTQVGVRTIHEAIARSRACHVIVRNFRKDGSTFWNELSLSPVLSPSGKQVTHYVGILNDITDRRDTEEKLFAAFTRLDTLFTLSPDGFVSFDATGRLTFANPSFERMFGLQIGDVSGMSVDALDACLREACDPGYIYTPLDLGHDSETPTETVLHVIKPALRVVKCTVRRSSSEEAQVMAYFRDITHESEVDRMKSEFLSTAAHELRTPMASIMGFSELLLTRQYDAERSRDLISTINRQSHRLTRLLNELLDLARIEARGDKEFSIARHDLGDIVNSVVSGFFVPDGRSPASVILPVEEYPVMVDTEKIQQAIINLLSNAYKYSPDGSPVEVEVLRSNDRLRPEVGVRITDHGMGMSEEESARAFERFYRADTSGRIPGTGLGLSLVKEIIEHQHGRVELHSTRGSGTTVWLWLPAAPDETAT